MRTRTSQRPETPELESFLSRLLASRGDDLEFVALFGSRARGDWSPGSDYDILIGLRGEDGKRLTDRIYEFSPLGGTDVDLELFPYARSQWQRMFEGRNLLMLEALEHGQTLFDRGAFHAMRQEFSRWRSRGEVTPFGHGWKIREPQYELLRNDLGSFDVDLDLEELLRLRRGD